MTANSPDHAISERAQHFLKVFGKFLGFKITDQAELLPSSLYLKNFLKAYASLLGMDPQHIMTGYLKNIGRN